MYAVRMRATLSPKCPQRSSSAHLGLGVAVLAVLITPRTAAAVPLVNGFWSSSLETCAEQAVPAGAFCGGWEVDQASWPCMATMPAQPSLITAAANYPGGGGGLGFRMFLGDTRNDHSTALRINFPTPQPEIWIRYYTRYPVGQQWGGIQEHKIFYAFTDASVAININFPQGMHAIGLQPRNTMGSPDLAIGGWGWNELYGSDLGDGSWHAFEHHLGLGTSGANDGQYQLWIDGVLRVDRRDLDFFDGGAATLSGWSHVELPSNHNVSLLPGCNGVDVDDLAVATPDYGGFVVDAGGSPMIGLLGDAAPDGGVPAGPDGGTPDGGAADDAAGGGCGCAAPGAPSSGASNAGLILAALLVWRRPRGKRFVRAGRRGARSSCPTE